MQGKWNEKLDLRFRGRSSRRRDAAGAIGNRQREEKPCQGDLNDRLYDPVPHRPVLPLGGVQVSQSVRRPVAPSWTPAQENIIRLYADMGLSPRQIAERARQNTPRLGVTEALAVRVMSAPRR